MIETNIKQKVGLVLFGIIVSLILLEIILRLSGFFMLSIQKSNGHVPEDSDVYRILVLGESTTAYFGPGRSTWSEQLEIMLNNYSESNQFKLFNEGLVGTTTSAILSTLEENLDYYKPDMVITMMGLNDGYMGRSGEYCLAFEYDNKMINEARNLRVYKLSQALYYSIDKLMDPKNSNHPTGPAPDIAYSGSINEERKTFMKYVGNGECEASIALLQYMLKNSTHNEKQDMARLLVFSNDCFLRDSSKRGMPKDLEIEIKDDELFKMKKYENLSMGCTEITKENYRLLYSMLKARGIKYIAMQYPTRDLDAIKEAFSNDKQKNIVFVSNKENFKEALELGNYEDYFIDKFAIEHFNGMHKFGGNTTFGHATKKGNMLIAENVANVIFREVKIKE